MANEMLTKLPGGMLQYHYEADDSAEAFEGFLLADIAQPYRQRFREQIADQTWIVEYGRRLAQEPFKADFVICTSDAAI